MRRLRLAALPVVTAACLAGCGTDPARGVAVPGAPAAATTIPRPSTTATTTTVAPTTTTTTTSPPTTTAAPAPTTTVAPATTDVATTTATPVVPSTTVAATTTTELVYVAEAATGTLRYGMEGPRSLQLQRDLIQLGFLPLGADDGQYGPGTAGGVRRFQESAGLVVDGVAGPITQAALAQAIADASAEE